VSPRDRFFSFLMTQFDLLANRLAKKKAKPLGLDLGSHTLKLMEIEGQKEARVVRQYHEVPLERGIIVEGTIMDRERLVERLRQLAAAARCQGKGVATSLAGQSVMIKKTLMVALEEHEMREAIRDDASKYFPFDNMDEVHFDFQVLGENVHNPRLLDVIIVAAKKECVESYVEVVERAGMKLVILDVDPFALETMYEENYDYEDGDVVALINIGAAVTSINVVKNAMSLFTRDVLLGGNTVTEALQTKYGLTFEEAEQLKLTSPPQSIDQAEFTQTLLYAIDPIVLEIERSIDYFRSTSEENDEIREVLLAGGGALIPGFTAELADRLRIPVAPVNPFRTIGIHKQLTGTRDFTHDGPRLAVVTGLALRNLGDK